MCGGGINFAEAGVGMCVVCLCVKSWAEGGGVCADMWEKFFEYETVIVRAWRNLGEILAFLTCKVPYLTYHVRYLRYLL